MRIVSADYGQQNADYPRKYSHFKLEEINILYMEVHNAE